MCLRVTLVGERQNG